MPGGALRNVIIFLITFALSACSEPGPLDDLARGEEGRVVRILDGDTVALSTGLVVKLASLEAPSFGRGGEPDDLFAYESARILEDLVMGRRVRLYYPGLTRDRYDRAIAHVETADDLGAYHWVNLAVARRGGARVRVYTDSVALADELLTAEESAQLGRSGLWSKRDYNTLSAAGVETAFRGFTVIEGTTLGTAGPGGQFAKCRLSIEGAAMLLEISAEASGYCNLPDRTMLRARGYVREGRMEITHPLNLTVIDQSS